jgi:glyceraldehyde 3-phosphate dehydrogenase
MANGAPIGVGLMGLGRIGRNLFRILQDDGHFELRAICDPGAPEALAYLLRFDTLLGRFPGTLELDGRRLRVGERAVDLLAGEPGQAGWQDLGVEMVVEAGKAGRSRAELEKHLDAGAKGVVLCAPPSDPPDLTVVMGINDDRLRAEHRIVSNGSSTAHAVAPVLRALQREFGVDRAFLSTVHAYTDQQRLADVPAAEMRSGRAAAENLIPQPSNAAQLLGELLPEIGPRLSAAAINVPVANGSAADLVIWHQRDVSVASVNEAVRRAAVASAGRLAFEEEPIVSSDVLGAMASGTFDAGATMTLGARVSKTLTWFDNGWAYSHRCVELMRRMNVLRRGAPEARAS